jgi:hypothetical protein
MIEQTFPKIPRQFPSSIWVGMAKGRAKPEYEKSNMLKLVRAEKKLSATIKRIRKMESQSSIG